MGPKEIKILENYLETGQTGEALQFLRALCRNSPEDVDAAIRLVGLLLNHHAESISALNEAAGILEKILALQPRRQDMRYNLALVYQHLQQPERAAGLYEIVLAAHPTHIEAAFNLALARHAMARPEAAEAILADLRRKRPDHPGAGRLLGQIWAETGHLNDAEAIFTEILRSAAGDHETAANLALVHYRQGKLDVAFSQLESLWQQGVRALPVARSLGLCAMALGRAGRASALFSWAKDQSDADEDWQNWVQAVAARAQTDGTQSSLSDEEWETALSRPLLDVQPLAGVLWREIRDLLSLSAGGIDGLRAVLKSLRLPLLTLALREVRAADAETETAVAHLRRVLLDAVLQPFQWGGDGDAALSLIGALAVQCFRNEYVFAVTEDECRLSAMLLDNRAPGDKSPEYALRWAMSACYSDPDVAFPAPQIAMLQPVVNLLVHAPKSARQIAAQLPALTETDADDVSVAVRAHYEDNPYPRWHRIDRQTGQSVPEILRRLFPWYRIGDDAVAHRPEILIAGCGTGKQAAAAAMRYAGAAVTAIDLSRASLAYAKQQAALLDLSSLRFYQGDILGLGANRQRYDVIECVGVLHHMADPVQGWRILREKLNAGGFMKIGLYSRLGRQDVVAAKKLIAAEGFIDTPSGIRAARQWLRQQSDPQLQGLYRSLDYYSLSECRDLLFHGHEQLFDLGRIAETMASLDLDFIGFEGLKGAILQQFRLRNPGVAISDIPAWIEFEQAYPATFQEMYQFWCRARD